MTNVALIGTEWVFNADARRKTRKRKNCTNSTSCGFGCISQKKTCWLDLNHKQVKQVKALGLKGEERAKAAREIASGKYKQRKSQEKKSGEYPLDTEKYPVNNQNSLTGFINKTASKHLLTDDMATKKEQDKVKEISEIFKGSKDNPIPLLTYKVYGVDFKQKTVGSPVVAEAVKKSGIKVAKVFQTDGTAETLKEIEAYQNLTSLSPNSRYKKELNRLSQQSEISKDNLHYPIETDKYPVNNNRAGTMQATALKNITHGIELTALQKKQAQALAKTIAEIDPSKREYKSQRDEGKAGRLNAVPILSYKVYGNDHEMRLVGSPVVLEAARIANLKVVRTYQVDGSLESTAQIQAYQRAIGLL